MLCDVRKNPVSMKYGFSKNKLQQYCKELGIFYCHFPSFGIESAQRQNLQTPEDYQKLFFTYKTNLHNRKEEINELLSLLEKYNRIALTCFESDSHFCHRSVLIDNITSQYKIPVGFFVMKEKILILVKTYPSLSKKYQEIVCTAGINKRGEWRRVYPMVLV